MSEPALNELLELIRPHIEKKDTVMRQAIPPQQRLAVTLRFIATGVTYQELSYSTRIAANTLSKIIMETLKAIVTALEGVAIKCPVTPLEWKAVAGQFCAQWQYPNCIGALDGKHITFRPPRAEGSAFRNYKGSDSIVLLAIVNANYQFLYVDIGRNGRMHDSSVFRDSTFSHSLSSGTLGLPDMCPLPGRNTPVPYVITADDAFPLKENIMKPYPGRDQTHDQRIFNYRLSRARRIVENAFGILSNRFRILLGTISLSVEKVELITYACCLLHNFLALKAPENYLSAESIEEDGQCHLQKMDQQSANRASNNAINIRNEFKNYFNGEGAVPWQERSVELGHA